MTDKKSIEVLAEAAGLTVEEATESYGLITAIKNALDGTTFSLSETINEYNSMTASRIHQIIDSGDMIAAALGHALGVYTPAEGYETEAINAITEAVREGKQNYLTAINRFKISSAAKTEFNEIGPGPLMTAMAETCALGGYKNGEERMDEMVREYNASKEDLETAMVFAGRPDVV